MQNGLLEGVVVVDLADGPGSFCSKLLADLGATVINIASPSMATHRANRSFRYINSNKLCITLDLSKQRGRLFFRKLMQRADALVEDFAWGHLEALDLGYRQLRRINPGLIHLSISRCGSKKPKGTCSSGQTRISEAAGENPPALPVAQSGYTASLFGANALLLNLRKRRFTGKGDYIDLSIQESVASTLGQAMIDYFHHGSVAERSNDNDPRESFSILHCKDGYIQIPIFRNLETLFELIQAEGGAMPVPEEKWQDPEYLKKNHLPIVAAVEVWTQNHSKHALFKLGQTMGFPWAPVESLNETLHSPQLKARQFFVRATPENRSRKSFFPGLPYKFSAFRQAHPMPSPPIARHTDQILRWLDDHRKTEPFRNRPSRSVESGSVLRGIRVLDFTRMLSGPYATRILGDFGAEIIKVQSRETASGAEQNDTPYFGAWNRNKRSISLNLDRTEARELLLELVAKCGVVVENFSPRVMANWGLTYKQLKTVRPDLIMASISAMGQTGPWKNYVGYAPTFHALSGFTHAISRNLDKPADIGFAYGDVIAGLYTALAVLASIEYRDRTGKGQYIDISAYEAVCTLLGPAFAAGRSQKTEMAAGAVPSAKDLAKDPRLAARHFFLSLEHPKLGKQFSDRSALWPHNEKPDRWRTAPELGEGNHYVFVDLLGHSEMEFRSWMKKGILEVDLKT